MEEEKENLGNPVLVKKKTKNMLTCGACRLHSKRLFALVQMHLVVNVLTPEVVI